VTRYEWAPSAARHGVSRARAAHVIDRATHAFEVRDEDGEIEPSLALFEIVVRIMEDDKIRVIHVMKMRTKYRPLYQQATR